jgi:PAS domain-containing protein
MPFTMVADGIVQMAVALVRNGDASQLHALDALPLAIYVTDDQGFLTYFNPACVNFTGRQPVLGLDRWCVTWKLAAGDGADLPHDQCPMAVALQTGHGTRGTLAVAERPDGSRVRFLPFPTPVVSASGELIGAVNMLVDMTNHRPPPAAEPSTTAHELKAQVEQALAKLTITEIKKFMEEVDMELGGRVPRVLN